MWPARWRKARGSVLARTWPWRVTGIAGPGGAEPGKPVGTVWLGLAGAHGSHAERRRFAGSRDEVRAQTVLWALSALEAALGGGGDVQGG